MTTDGEFVFEKEIYQMLAQKASNDIHLNIFSYDKNKNKSEKLNKLVENAQGSYDHIAQSNAINFLIKY